MIELVKPVSGSAEPVSGSVEPSRLRLFVALDLPDPVRNGLARWQEAELLDPALRPVPAAGLHLTLAFLGYRDEREVEAIAGAALVPWPRAPVLTLGTAPVAIPPRGRPRLYAVEAPGDGVPELQAEVSRRLVAGGFYKPEERPFWPHLTVARVRRDRPGSKRPAVVQRPPGELPEELQKSFGAVRIALYRSILRPQGAEYVPIRKLNLTNR